MAAKKSPAVKVAVKQAAAPVRRSPEVMDAIVTGISQGIPLREICRQDGMPNWTNVYMWMEQDESFKLRIARARETGYDAIAAESLEIVDATPERGPDGKIDAASVAHAKLRAEHRLKLLAKWSPKKYGDKVETTVVGPDGGPVALSLKVSFVVPDGS